MRTYTLSQCISFHRRIVLFIRKGRGLGVGGCGRGERLKWFVYFTVTALTTLSFILGATPSRKKTFYVVGGQQEGKKKEEENPPRGRGCREKTKKSILPVLTRCFQYTKSGQVNDLPPCPLICEGFSSVLSSVFRDKKLEKIFSSSTPPGSWNGRGTPSSFSRLGQKKNISRSLFPVVIWKMICGAGAREVSFILRYPISNAAFKMISYRKRV